MSQRDPKPPAAGLASDRPSAEPTASRDLWTLLRAVAAAAPRPARETVGLALDRAGALVTAPATAPDAVLVWRDGTFAAAASQPPAARDLVALYAPLLAAPTCRPFVLAHLGQSIDAQIATGTGDSCFVNGAANIVHLHRLRALSDAVIIGAGTAATDDPRLTTRLVEGPNPTRVVIDPNRRTSSTLGLFNDGAAPTLVACAQDRVGPGDDPARVIGVARDGDGLALAELAERLAARGLRRLFVEGGGITVSRWLTARQVDRLHLAVAPVLIGDGRRALHLPPAATMAACPRPPARVFRLGEDLLWDFDLRGAQRIAAAQPDAAAFWPVAVT